MVGCNHKRERERNRRKRIREIKEIKESKIRMHRNNRHICDVIGENLSGDQILIFLPITPQLCNEVLGKMLQMIFTSADETEPDVDDANCKLV